MLETDFRYINGCLIDVGSVHWNTPRHHQSPNDYARARTNRHRHRNNRVASKIRKNNEIIARMQQYVLESWRLKDLGFPVQYGTDENRAMVNYTPYDVAISIAEGRRTPDRKTQELESTIDESSLQSRPIKRTCSRCKVEFYSGCVNDLYLREDECIHHWGKLQTFCADRRWSCCNNYAESKGCDVAETHVWYGLVPGSNGPLNSYVRTQPSKVPRKNPSVYAIDCEMVYTQLGLELAKVSVIDIDGKIVYDTYVKPEKVVIDYNSRFSGITAEKLVGVHTYLPEVQARLLGFIFSDTILIGHGLENDLRALRLIHENVIDTSICFEHSYGLPYRFGLKTLAKKILNREIQKDAHDSCVDARTVMDLMLHRVDNNATGR